MQQFDLWIMAWLAAGIALGALVAGLLMQRQQRKRPLPQEWLLAARSVFNSDERRLLRLLEEALPQHVLLAKLPLVRFCQPTDPHRVREWYALLGAVHVSFAICNANGRVLAAIDLDKNHDPARRSVRVKNLALAACRVRYERYAPDALPTVGQLQALLPAASAEREATRAFAPSQPASLPPLQAKEARPPWPAPWREPVQQAANEVEADMIDLDALGDIGGVVVETPKATARQPTRH